MGPIKIHNGGNYAHAQDYNAYNFCLELKFRKTYKNVHWTVFEGQYNMEQIKKINGRK